MNTRLTILVLLAVAAVSGCGYSTEPLLATADNGEPIRSVAVAIVANDSHRRQYEEPLTDAILSSPWVLAGANPVVLRDPADPVVWRVRTKLLEPRFSVHFEGELLERVEDLLRYSPENEDTSSGMVEEPTGP